MPEFSNLLGVITAAVPAIPVVVGGRQNDT